LHPCQRGNVSQAGGEWAKLHHIWLGGFNTIDQCAAEPTKREYLKSEYPYVYMKQKQTIFL